MRWFVSDIHLMHENILKFCRPNYASVDVMNEDIVAIWNSYVKPEDTVYNLGDLAFKTGQKKDAIAELLSRLNGYHILIKGNHDETKKIAAFPAIRELHENMELKLGDTTFFLSHYPYKQNMTEKDIRERPELYTPDQYWSDQELMPLLHGHTHEAFTIRPRGLCLCWDRWHRPVSEEEVLAIFKDTDGFWKNLDKYNNKENANVTV